MSPQIVWADSAAKAYDNLPAQMRKRIDTALYVLVTSWRGDVQRLQGKRDPEFRLRVGEYRVRFSLPEGTNS